MRSFVAGLTAVAVLLALAGCSSSEEAVVGADGLPLGARYLDDDPACTAPRCF